MNKADRIAIDCGHTLLQLEKVGITPTRIIFGAVEWNAITNNPSPREDADLKNDGADYTFLGVPCIQAMNIAETISWEFNLWK